MIALLLVIYLAVLVPSLATVDPLWGLIGLAVLVLVTSPIWVPRLAARRWRRDGLAGRDLFDIEQALRMTILQLVAGIAVVSTLALTAWQANNAQEAVRRTERGQATDRFMQAASQLGATDSTGRPNLPTRIGAIHTFARFANDNGENVPAVLDILVAYVRLYAPPRDAKKKRPPLTARCGFFSTKVQPDIQAAVTVVMEYASESTGYTAVNLSGLDLTGIDLHGSSIQDANLSGATLVAADLSDTLLAYTNFAGADLRAACFARADLTGVSFARAHLEGASFENAVLEKKALSGAILNKLTRLPTDS